MKEKILQLIPQKYKRSSDATMNNYKQQTRQPRKNRKILRNIQLINTESRRNRKPKQINY